MTGDEPATSNLVMQTNTPAMARALAIYSELARMVPDDPNDGQDLDSYMSSGLCAFGFRWSGAPDGCSVWAGCSKRILE
jgi:hypothetical protein